MQPEEATAKFWVKNPGGAIRRNERMGASPDPSLTFGEDALAIDSVANGNGFKIQPSGSGGDASRPAIVKLLKPPPASPAHAWLWCEQTGRLCSFVGVGGNIKCRIG